MSVLLGRLIKDVFQCVSLVLVVGYGVTTGLWFEILGFVAHLARMLGG